MMMLINYVLGKINEEIDYVSVFHNQVALHMVWIWLHSQLVKLH